MKFNPFLFSVIFLLGMIGACSKSSTNNTTKACDACEGILAPAKYDNSEKGVYKGVTLNGTGIGHFKFNYLNDSPNTYLILKFTRVGNYPVLNDSLVVVPPINNSAGISQFKLLGAASSNQANMTTFPNNSSLSDFTLSGSIGTGAKPQTSMMKETSTEEVKIYEGTMTINGSTGEAGKVGFVIRGSKIEGIITSATNGLRESFYNGTITNNSFKFTFSGNNSAYEGTITNDKDISGSITLNGAAYGNFTAARSY